MVNHKLQLVGEQARTAATTLGQLSTTTKNELLEAMAMGLVDNQAAILQANATDLAEATGLKQSFVDRLTLTESRIADMANGMRQVAG